MKKHGLGFLGSSLIYLSCVSSAWALPESALVNELNKSVLRVEVVLANGKHGLGSGVVVAKNELITNCHVVANATDINVIQNGDVLIATAIKPDWKHDLCLLTVAGLSAPMIKIGASENLQYETPVFTVGYPGKTTTPVNTFGVVKGLFAMDGSVVIRATSPFNLGASGGGVFDDAGSLVGIITLKSRGEQANYFYMPVEWVQALMKAPAQAIGAKSEKPFWAANGKQRPYFMQVVQPTVTHDWQALRAIGQEWVSAEPSSAEAWFYLAMAEFETNAYGDAKTHFNLALALNQGHSQAIEYLRKMSQKTAISEAKQLALLVN